MFRTLCNVRSVPINALGEPFTPERLHANCASLGTTDRQAAALVASAVANRVLLEPGAVLPRLFTVNGIVMAIENGVGRDMLSSGMARLEDTTVGAETLELTRGGYRFEVSELGRQMLEDAEVLLPRIG